MKHLISDEEGHVIVEATFVLPVAILMVLALFYVAIFLCQRANLQANLNNSVLYYKNIQSDTFIGQPTSDATYVRSEGSTQITGSQFNVSGSRFPYRKLFMDKDVNDTSRFADFFKTMTGTMFFDKGDNITVEYETTNWIIYKKIKATARQTVIPAISFKMLGIDNEMTITASASAVISDGDGFVQNVDFVADLIYGKFKKQIDTIKNTVGKVFNKINSLFEK